MTEKADEIFFDNGDELQEDNASSAIRKSQPGPAVVIREEDAERTNRSLLAEADNIDQRRASTSADHGTESDSSKENPPQSNKNSEFVVALFEVDAAPGFKDQVRKVIGATRLAVSENGCWRSVGLDLDENER